MIRINKNFQKLKSTYLFTDIARKVADFQEEHPEKSIIKMGIGDVTKALPPSCIKAFHAAVDEMADDSSFRGYGPEQGYDFLKDDIARNDFQSRGADISKDEIFISDGAKCDSANFQELFSTDLKVAVPDPVYPVYVDTNVMSGRTGGWKDGRYEGLVYLESTESNNYIPAPPEEAVDLIYLCFPNNPTGATASSKELSAWIAYAQEHKALILYDSAYAAFIRDSSLPQSIYELPGAKEVAVEFRSFSKTSGFTGTRCAYTIVPEECRAYDNEGNPQPIREMWNRRHATKFNGVSYPVQRAAQAVFSAKGKRETKKLIDYYLENASIIRSAMEKIGYACTGGSNSPYVWTNVGDESWSFFDKLLENAGVVCTPGSGFGKCGEGYIRLSAFNSRENVEEAMDRIRAGL